MKRMWIGAGLLAAVLAAGLWVSGYMEQAQRDIARDLERAAACALEEDWDMAMALAARAEKNWEKKRALTAVFSDHGPIEQADSLFAQLDIFGQRQNEEAFSSTCLCLASQLKALGESHRFTLSNLL